MVSGRIVSSRPSGSDASSRLTFWLQPVLPFDLGLTVWALRRRTVNIIDRWDGKCYRRLLVLKNQPVGVAVSESGRPGSSRLHVTLTGSRLDTEVKRMATQVLQRLLGLKIDVRPFYQLAAVDVKLGPLAERFRGVKPPRFPSLFEALVNAIACQLLSLSVGIILLGRLATKFGVAMESVGGTVYAFPRPEELARFEPQDFRPLGFSLRKGQALVSLARTWLERESDFEDVESVEDSAVIERLLQLPGIGRWSAEYALLRGLGRLDTYPGDDVGARNNLGRWLNLRKPLNYEGVRRITARWQPYSGFVYFHLLLDRLEAAGALNVPQNAGL